MIMYANGATMETFRKFEVLWWVLLDDYLALLRVAWGSDHQQGPNNTFGSLKTSMSATPSTMETFRVSKVLWWFVLRVLSQFSKKNKGCRGARIINRIHHNNFNSLKASMVTGFAEMSRKENTLLLMNRYPLQPPRLLFF